MGESQLELSEVEMTKWGIIPVNLMPDAHSKKSTHTTKFFPHCMYSYGQVFSAIFLLAFLFSIAAAIYAFFQIGAIQKVIHYIHT